MSALTNTAKWSISVSLIVFHWFILCPFVCYYLFKFNQRKDEIIIFKRYPKIVIYINILSLMFIVFHRPIHILLQLSPLRELKSYFLGTMWNVIAVTVYLLQWLYLARFWLMFYDLKHGNSSINTRWKLYLNPALVEDDFWTKHHQNFGSVKFAIKIALILWFLTSLFWAIPYQLSLSIDYYDNGPIYRFSIGILGAVHLIVATFCTILWCQAPRISDVFYLRFEMKILIIICWLLFVAAILFMVIQYIVSEYTDNEIAIYSLSVLQTITAAIFYSLFGIVSTMFILNKMNKAGTTNLECKSMYNLRNVRDVILHKEYFELFVQHLCREFSMELILSFVELLQFKEKLNKTFNLEENGIINNMMTIYEMDDTENGGFEIDFDKIYLSENPKIPKSHLIENAIDGDNELNIETYLKIACLLFNKYIKTNSDLEINISGEMRTEYINDMKDMNLFINKYKDTMEPIQLFKYFGPVIEELNLLLLFSFDRFMQTDIQINVTRLVLMNKNTTELENILKPKTT